MLVKGPHGDLARLLNNDLRRPQVIPPSLLPVAAGGADEPEETDAEEEDGSRLRNTLHDEVVEAFFAIAAEHPVFRLHVTDEAV